MPAQRSFETGAVRGMLAMPAALLRLVAGRPIVRDEQTLDVQCQLLIKMLRMRGAALGGRSVDEERRQMVERSQTLAPEAEGDLEVYDLTVQGGEGHIGGRCYRPRAATTPMSAIVFFHGGGFVLGDLDTHDGLCRTLADRTGAAVIAVDYRLAPEHPAPAAAYDAVAAYRDIVARADSLSIDRDRIAVAGDSAGGNLAAIVAQRARGDEHAPCYQALFYPVTDFAEDKPSKDRFATGFLLEKASMDWFEQHYIPADYDKRDPWVSPLYAELAGVAPALVLTAGFDPLRDEGYAYAQALEAAGVVVEYRQESGLVHGFLNFAAGVERANESLDYVAGTLRRVLAA